MANKSVLGAPSAPQGSGHREGFSMSQTFTFTAAAGMLLPTYKQILNPGEKVVGVPKFFARTQPLLAPAMADVDIYVDVFFVPMRHLYSMFDSWFTQVDDSPSALWSGEDWTNHLPVVGQFDQYTGKVNAFSWVTADIFNTRVVQNPNLRFLADLLDDVPGITYGFDMHRLVQHLGYNAQSLFSSRSWSYAEDYDEVGPIVPDFRHRVNQFDQSGFAPYYFQAYQKIYYDYYRDTDFEVNNVQSYNLDDVMNQGIEQFVPQSASQSRAGMFQLRYRSRSKDYFTAVHPSPLYNSIGMLPGALQNLSKVKNWLDMSDGVEVNQPDIDLLAGSGSYQLVAPDDLNPYDTGGSINRYNYDSLQYYNAVFYNNNLHIGDSSIDSSGRGTSIDQAISHDHSLSFLGAIEDGALGLESSGVGSSVSLNQIRTAFALDKVLRTTMRAGKHIDDQILATFGVKVPQGVSGEVYKIKSYHTNLHIGEVVQSATTVDSSGADVPLGELAGRGVAVLNDNDKFSFTAPCHGILMSIFSIAPRYKYLFGREKDGTKVYLEDFFRPQTDGLGMQPLFRHELGLPSTVDNSDLTGVWQYRYMEDKIKFDKATEVFSTIGLNPWSLVSNPNLPIVDGSFARGRSWFKVYPWDMNNIFVTQYNGDCTFPGNTGSHDFDSKTKNPEEFLTNYLRDPFIVDFNMQCTKVSQMSTFGEPVLGGI